MRLQKHAVDLLEVDGSCVVARGLGQGAEAEIARFAQTAFGRADDEAERVVGEGVVRERHLVELSANEIRKAKFLVDTATSVLRSRPHGARSCKSRTSMDSWVGRWICGAAFALALAGCNNPGGATTTETSSNSGASPTHAGGTSTGTWSKAVVVSGGHVAQFASFTPLNQTAGGAGGAAGGGTGSQLLAAPYGVSDHCGDAIVGADEECDDGDEGSDACTASCKTRDQPAVPIVPNAPVDRYLGAGRHPNAGLAGGFITTYVEQAADEPDIEATLFNIWGQPAQRVKVSDGGSPIDEANPVAAALPGGSYAVSWSDFDGDGSDLGVALRQVRADGSLGPLRAANAGAEFSQLNPDMVWTGSQLVVAWEDYADAFNGPDLRYRTFDADLNPTSDDVSLAVSELPEAAVALATSNGAWAAAYREGTVDGNENIVVKVGDGTFRVGPICGGPLDDRPALVGLDATHWLVAFSAGTNPTSGVYNLSRVRYAVIDTTSAAAPTGVSLDPLDDVYTYNDQIAQISPAAVRGPEGVYLAWRSKGRVGDAAGDQIWLKYLRWTQGGTVSHIRAEEAELLIPRTCDGSFGDQRTPALATTQLPPGGALAIAWTDFGRTLGDGSGEPDVLVQYAPTHLTTPGGAPQKLTETWANATGAAFPARWSTNAAPPVTFTTQFGEGEFNALSLPGSGFALVNDHTAENTDVISTVRLPYPGYAALITRADGNTTPTSYLGAVITTKKADVWAVFSVINGVGTYLQTLPLPKSFYEPGIGVNVDFRVRLRTATNADGSLFMGMKAWRVGATEPTSWLPQITLPPTSPTVQALGNVAGRFGIWANIATANGNKVDFDDFSATYFEGAVAGDLDAPVSQFPLLLPRSAATYRLCSGASCKQTSACCSGPSDCAAGLACSSYQSEGLGLGSDNSICVAPHCADQVKSPGELRADCGGPDCKACECTSTLALGAAGYCSSTTPACLCGQGEYPCARNVQCLPGLICAINTGERYNAPAGTSACVPPHCVNRVQDAGETAIDCGGPCGSNCVCGPTNGAIGHCRTYCQCANGNGHCSLDDECAPGLICGLGKGPRFGLAANVNACLPLTCTNNIRDSALGETSTDCGGACGCGGCPTGCH